jgi:uncharacterized protein YaiE (UPF0345 family)
MRRLLLAALLLAAAALPAASPARALEGLVVVADTTYTVLPDAAAIQVVIEAVATSYQPDTPEGQTYYSGVSFAVPAGSANFAANSDGQRLTVRVADTTDDYTVIQVDFSRGVFFEESYAYTVSFELVDSGGAADRDLRIGRSVVAFPVWTFGDDFTDPSRVQVVIPAPFSATIYGSSLATNLRPDGSTQLTAETTEPSSWFAYVIAERPGIFVVTPFEVEIAGEPEPVRIRAWDDDPDWGDRLRQVMSDGLPVLQEMIGLPWPVRGDLTVEESAVRRLGEYAGIYDPQTELITVRYDADAVVALHEAAHAWFNTDLLDGRWIGEAWAEFYGVQAAQAIGLEGETFELSDDLLAARIPLNDWGAIASEDADTEAFAYAATYHLAGLIHDRTDDDGLRTVWRAAVDDEASYQPIHAVGEPVSGADEGQPGWQRLLDLLEERTGAAFTDLWQEWVADAAQQTLLTQRGEARQQYAAVVADAGDWELPVVIRTELGAWRFGPAEALLTDAAEVLDLRDQIATRAEALDLQPPAALEAAFEQADAFDQALDEGAAELAALSAISDATRSLGDEVGPLEWLGLLFEDPAAQLDGARDLWEAGDASRASADAAAAQAVRDGSEAAGRDRLLLGGGGALVLVGTGGGLAWARRRRRNRPEPLTPI